MPQPKKAARFGGTPAHHSLMMSNLATELFRHGGITTTHARAKTVQPVAERLITQAKRGDVHSRRLVLRTIRDKDVVHKLFADIAPLVADRNGGYTRVIKLGPRKGDGAAMARIELVEGVIPGAEKGELEEAPRRRWSLRRRRGTISRTAAEREVERLAAVDAGELEGGPVDDEPEPVDAVPAGALTERDLAREDVPSGESGLSVRPEDVEARLADDEDDDDDRDADADGDSAGEDDEPRS